MSTHNTQFHDKIKFLLVFVFELSGEFRRDSKNEFELTMVNESSMFELLRFDRILVVPHTIFQSSFLDLSSVFVF